MKNKVYLVGAGPGDPGLITVRGREILRQADVVIYDYLVDRRLLEFAKEEAELICCDKLGKPRPCAQERGKDRYSDGFLIHNEKISQLVIKKAREGKKVIRLKNGDVSIFSRTAQELEPLIKNQIDFELVPGVTAASAASSFNGIPLTDRRFASACVFATGHEDPQKEKSSLDWDCLAKSGTIVLYMAVENLEKIIRYLIKTGKNKATPIAIIQDASLVTQKVLIGTLEDIVQRAKEKDVKPPAIIIIGEVVKLEKEFNWLRKSKRILFTGLSKERFFIKGRYFHLPLIKIEPISDYREFDRYLKNIRKFDWIVFTSRYGVQYFFARLSKVGYDSRVLKDINIAAIGNSTKDKLLDFGVCADLVPEEESSQGLINAFKKIGIKDKRIFLPRSDISDKGLAAGLRDLGGGGVTPSIAYKNIMPKGLPDLDLRCFDEVIFTSPSGVRNFIKRYGKLPLKIKVSCIGEVTKNEARKSLRD